MIIQDLPTPAVLVHARRLERNLAAMQNLCAAGGCRLWPHAKTHKLVPILRRQLELGADGATFAKLGEAEALASAGASRVFLAHSLVRPDLAPRLARLADKTETLVLAATSLAQFEALEHLISKAGIHPKILLAVDSGLHREGTRSPEQTAVLADRIRQSRSCELIGLYTHEGHTYRLDPSELDAAAEAAYRTLIEHATAAGGNLPLWPGCSITATRLAGLPGVEVLRPGAYVFGDLRLSQSHSADTWDDMALTVLCTVVDRPEPGLALLDAGSKTLSSDASGKIFGRVHASPDCFVKTLSEEHGFLQTTGERLPPIGEKVEVIVAHACPVLNLASHVYLVEEGRVLETWPVDGRGRSD